MSAPSHAADAAAIELLVKASIAGGRSMGHYRAWMDADPAARWQITVSEEGVIYSTFVGPTPTAEISKFIDALVLVMPPANARLVFDLRELGGYNSETKGPMKAWLLKYKLAIQDLTVIVPKTGTILKVVVAAIALATGVKISIREELEPAAGSTLKH